MTTEPYNRAEEIVLVAVNDRALHDKCVYYACWENNAAFFHYASIVNVIQREYKTNGWEPFTMREMADAIVLLDEHFRKEGR